MAHVTQPGETPKPTLREKLQSEITYLTNQAQGARRSAESLALEALTASDEKASTKSRDMCFRYLGQKEAFEVSRAAMVRFAEEISQTYS